jgi:DNA (cytosine-5)-methyltransferase 1
MKPYSYAPAGLVLSLFPGIDLLGRGFENVGFCVVRGPDLIHGGDMRTFHPVPGMAEGIIGGPPCQEFSRARRIHNKPTGEGLEMIGLFDRAIRSARPLWFLMENVPGLPDLSIGGPEYLLQRFHLCASHCGGRQRRLRVFIFGSREGKSLVIERRPPAAALVSTCMASEGQRKKRRRSWGEFCELQGLPADFSLPGLSVAARYRAVGNGVPVFMAEAIARSIRARVDYGSVRLCLCGCGRILTGRSHQAAALVSCRKRLERVRSA